MHTQQYAAFHEVHKVYSWMDLEGVTLTAVAVQMIYPVLLALRHML